MNVGFCTFKVWFLYERKIMGHNAIILSTQKMHYLHSVHITSKVKVLVWKWQNGLSGWNRAEINTLFLKNWNESGA